SLGDRRAAAVDSLRRQRQALVGGMTDVQEQQERLEQAMRDMQAIRADILKKLADAQALLGRLTEAERSQLRRAVSGSERTSLSDLGITMPKSGRLTCADVPINIPAGKVGKVLTYACAQI